MATDKRPKTASDFIAGIKDLPSLPQVVTKVLASINSGRASAADVASVMSEDPAMTAKVLRLVNSAYYGVPNSPISSVPFAISRMGFNEVKSIALSMGILKAFKGHKGALDHKEFWKHSVLAALAAKTIAEMARNKVALHEGEDTYFVAGLLHDIGVFILDQHLPDVFAKVVAVCEKTGDPLHELEKQWIGFGHQEVGAEILKKWKQAGSLIDAVMYHHHPQDAPEASKTFARVVYLAHGVATNVGSPLALEGLMGEVESDHLFALGLCDEQLPEIMEKTEQSAEKSEVLLSILG